MKKLIAIIILTVICGCAMGGEGFKTLGVDYSLRDEILKPVSVGVTSWSDKENGTVLGGFASACCMAHKDIRFELGVAFTTTDRLEIAPLTGISTPIEDNFIIGAWYAPFWNLYNLKSSDDPWGFMVGYRF